MTLAIIACLTLPIDAPTTQTPRGNEWVIAPGLRVDRANGWVVVDAEVAVRSGQQLELLLCPKRSKDHESIFIAEFRPREFHTALLLAGAVPGRPLRVDPFQPPLGQRIKVWMEIELDGQYRCVDARACIKDHFTKRALAADFVFAGSQIVRAPGVDRPIYMADDGDVVSVSNFAGSIVDVAMKSSDRNAELLFLPFSEHIPAKGSNVRLVVEPIVE